MPDRGRVRSRFHLGEIRLMRPKDPRAETDQAERCPGSMMVDLFGNVQTNGWGCCTMRFSGAAKRRCVSVGGIFSSCPKVRHFHSPNEGPFRLSLDEMGGGRRDRDPAERTI